MTVSYTHLDVYKRQAQYGLAITRAELVGLIPQKALLDAARWYLQIDPFHDEQVLELSLIHILLAVAFLLRVDFIFYILYVLVGVFLWSRWFTPRAMRNLTAARTYRRRAFLGETVEVTLTLTNKSRLSLPWLQFHESVPPELRLEESIPVSYTHLDVYKRQAWR